MISDLNRKITVHKYTFGQDQAGGNTKTLLTSYEMWAKVEENSENRALDNLQVSYLSSWRVTLRHEATRPLYENDEIMYDSNLFSIHSITRKNEGRVNYLEVNVHSTETVTAGMITVSIGWQNSPILTSDVVTFNYQANFITNSNTDIIADYAGAPRGSYLVLRYPVSQPAKAAWFNTAFNFGAIPDSVFQAYADVNYRYVISRVDVALQANNKKIIFS
jgi:head-tail adaptor